MPVTLQSHVTWVQLRGFFAFIDLYEAVIAKEAQDAEEELFADPCLGQELLVAVPASVRQRGEYVIRFHTVQAPVLLEF